ncbi:hypothetical protein [Meiothermus sp. QL-1]|nr:hypothetical protein [Meiothermus sp. QL-1]
MDRQRVAYKGVLNPTTRLTAEDGDGAASRRPATRLNEDRFFLMAAA